MKLIRKDYAQDIVINESKKYAGFEFCFKPVYDRITDCVEVEAIPIEWIKNWCVKNYPTYPRIITEQLLKKTETWRMIEDWEKENGRSE